MSRNVCGAGLGLPKAADEEDQRFNVANLQELHLGNLIGGAAPVQKRQGGVAASFRRERVEQGGMSWWPYLLSKAGMYAPKAYRHLRHVRHSLRSLYQRTVVSLFTNQRRD
jgi:hypothetical protein